MITSGYRNVEIEHGENSQHYSLDMDDPDSEFKYFLDLGWENERSKWVGKVKPYHESLKIFGGIPREQIVSTNLSRDEFDQSAESTDISPIDPTLTFRAFPTDQETSKKPYFNDFQLSTTEKSRTVQKLEKISKFIEDAVNAMGKVKGIPQSGTLTLLPLQDLPQM